jgi:hypothetical protein
MNKTGGNNIKSLPRLRSTVVLSTVCNIYYCSARDWERSGLLEENPQSGCSDICASLKGPL